MLSNNKTKQNPFPGLRPFREDESHLFFGREKQIDELLNILQNTRLLAVVGSSGSGKSSLVKCGLIPSLHNGQISDAGSNWNVTMFTPGNNPFSNMANGLVDSTVEGNIEPKDKQYHASIIEATLRRNSHGLIDLYNENSKLKKTNLLVVIDQFEEIFRFRKQEIQEEDTQQDTVTFINLLLETAKLQETPIYIVFTMRSDFLGDCTLFNGLPEAINDGQYLIPRMTSEERKKAILGPISVAGATATEQLITRLLNDVGNNPDQLPILQHALMRTWEYWQTHENISIPIDLKHYESIGGMEQALSRHAEEAYAELKTEKQRRTCELMFRALTEKGLDSKGTRRPLPVQEIVYLTASSTSEVNNIIDTFRKKGRSFLMPSMHLPLLSETIIDISHESLMRVWDRLIKWVDEEQQSSETYLRLAEAAALYQQSKSGLWRNPELQLALRWQERNQPNEVWAKRYNPSFERAISFLDYSKKQFEFELQEKERRQLARLKRTRLVAIVVGIAAILALILATYAIFQRAEAVRLKANAEEQRGIAEQNADEAIKQKKLADEARIISEANEKEAIKQKKLADEQRSIAILQKIEAQNQKEEAQKQRSIAEKEKERADNLRTEAEDNAAIAVRNEKEALTQKERADKLRTIAEENEATAVINEKEAKRLRNLAVARNQSLEASQLISDGNIKNGAKVALEAYQLNKENKGPHQNDANYQALNNALNSLKPNAYLYQDPSSIRAISIKPNYNELVIANQEGAITILKQNKTSIQKSVKLKLNFEQINAVGYTENKKHLYAASQEGNLAVWNLSNLTDKSKPIFKQKFNSPILNTLPISNNTIVIQTNNQVSIHEIQQKSTKEIDTKRYPNIRDIVLSKDNQILAIASGNNIKLHNINKNATLNSENKNIALNKTITKLAFSSNKKYLAAGLEDGQVAIIELNTSLKPIKIHYESMHQTMISGLAFYQQADFLQLASSSFDNTAKLTDITNLHSKNNQQDKIILKGHTKWIYDLIYSASGKYIYTINEDKTMRAWHTQSGDMVEDLKTLTK